MKNIIAWSNPLAGAAVGRQRWLWPLARQQHPLARRWILAQTFEEQWQKGHRKTHRWPQGGGGHMSGWEKVREAEMGICSLSTTWPQRFTHYAVRATGTTGERYKRGRRVERQRWHVCSKSWHFKYAFFLVLWKSCYYWVMVLMENGEKKG